MRKFLICLAIAAIAKISLALVNINQADDKQLQTVKGIGPKKAQAIIEYRNVHGKFNNIYELTQVKGFNFHSVNSLSAQIEAK